MLGNLIGGLVGGLFGRPQTAQVIDDPLARQEKFAKEMANKQADAAILKMKTDTESAISAGKTASWSLASNSLSSAAKEIRY